MNTKATPEGKIKFYDACIQAVHDYFVKDLSQKEAAEMNGIGEKSLRKFLNRLGIKKP